MCSFTTGCKGKRVSVTVKVKTKVGQHTITTKQKTISCTKCNGSKKVRR